MRHYLLVFSLAAISLHVVSCKTRRSTADLIRELDSLKLTRGEITLCGSGASQFGTVTFSLACSEKVRSDFNLATALLHSFEYTEAEKMFAKVMDAEPTCVMAYWGAAMSNFHPLWAPPSQEELRKGERIITLARTLTKDNPGRETDYVEAIATIFDNWKTLDHKMRVGKFENASQQIYEKYPDDKEAAIFYALALRAASDPNDKTFIKQKKAGQILNTVLADNPNHPGVAHYIIHNYDYPELADLALPAARKYASIAAASAHAQHMPSHIFTRLGLWDEDIQSNRASIDAARCYAQQSGMTGHWDEELHGMDYLLYASLQKAQDDDAQKQIEYLATITNVYPQNLKDAYTFAAMPARYAVERRDWKAASELKLAPADFPWDKFPWEKSNLTFARLLGAVHVGDMKTAESELVTLNASRDALLAAKRDYEANLLQIQIKASEAWMKLKKDRAGAIALMTEAADMEDATEKHPVTPGEILPARELLADMFMEVGDFVGAVKAYEDDLIRHPNRFNGVYGLANALEKLGQHDKAREYYLQLLAITDPASSRPELVAVRNYFNKQHASL